MTNIKKLREERGRLDHKIKALLEKAESENRDLTSEESKTYDKLHADDMALKRRIERAEQEESRSKELSQTRNAGNLTPQEAAGAVGQHRGDAATGEDQSLALRSWFLRQVGKPLTARQKEACRKLRFNPAERELAVNSSSSHEFRAMQHIARTRRSISAHDLLQTRALAVGGTGATLIPEGFVYQLEAALLTHGPMWQTSEILRTDSGNEMPWPTMNDTANEAVLLTEATTIGSSVDPSMSAVTFNAYKYSSTPILVSVEMLEDSAFDLATYIADALGIRIARGTNRAFTTDNGSSKPNGIVNAATVGVTAAAANAFTADELIDLFYSVDPAYRSDPSCGWMMHDSTIGVVRKLKQNDEYLWSSGFANGQPDTLIGKGVHVNNHMDGMNDDATDTGEDVALFGALAKYKIRQVRDIRLKRLVERYADTDQEAFVAYFRVDGDLLDAGTHPVKKLRLA